MKKTALISVYDKTGIIDFAKALVKLNYDIVSTGGTLKILTENHIKAIPISDITGFPEIMDGRVKTLHPKIFGGLLAIRDDKNHMAQAQQHGIHNIDMVVCNLYPFAKVVENKDSTWEDIIENIDIGGPSMLRAAAKNYKYVDVICDPEDYEEVITEITESGETPMDLRLCLAQKVFAHVSDYDCLIAKTIAVHDLSPIYIPNNFQTLRYGENPHQKAEIVNNGPDIITQLHGKELSYNNFLDIDAALRTIYKFTKPTVAIIKHTNPCGIASAQNITKAYQKAFATDTVSPYGGIIVTNAKVDTDFVETINAVFTEIIIAPAYTEPALKKLEKKKNRRVISYDKKILATLKDIDVKLSCLNGILVQSPDLLEDDETQWTFPTQCKPTESDLAECRFAWQVVKMLKSNAICFTRDLQTIGMGIGQTSRIDSLNIAIERAGRMGLSISGSVCASDGFFPFRDSIDRLAGVGVKCVIQPGGSVSDSEVISACDEHGIAMVMTGRRHFRH